MKTWQQYLETIDDPNRPPVPGGGMQDRSLEAFRALLDQLELARKSIIDPNAKSEITPLIVQFREQMRQILLKYKGQGVGYSPRYQPSTPLSTF